MKLGVLYSGGKDSNLAAYIAKNEGYEITCLISINSQNKESFMFHTPSINNVEIQAKTMGIPIIIEDTKGKKEEELKDLEKAIKKAIKDYEIEGIVTGAVESVYQASRIQKICDSLEIECFNPLWQRNQIELLNELVRSGFHAIIVGVFAEPLNESWLGREINDGFINDIKKLNTKYGINEAGEGGEYETLVLNSPLFKKPLEIKKETQHGGGNSCYKEVELK